MREEVMERASALMSGWEQVMAGTAETSAVVDDYLSMGGGDPEDPRSTYVDMLADIGLWLGGEDGFRKAVGQADGVSPVPGEDDGDVMRVARIVGCLKQELAAIGEDPQKAVWMAISHIAAEESEESEDEDGFRP